MNQCIKCGRGIPEGELFCAECSKDPIIASLGQTPNIKAPVRSAPAKKPVPAPQKKQKNRLTAPFIWVCLALALCLGLLLTQYGRMQVEKNRLRTREDELTRQLADFAETEDLLAETTRLLEKAEETIQDKEQELKTLTARLADSQSSQNQGEYDLSTTQKELTALQEEYDAMKEEYDLMVTAIEAAAKYKDKAEFLDKYVVFAPNDGTRLYHTYDCEKFSKSNFWTYSPKLAQAQGFNPCPECGE